MSLVHDRTRARMLRGPGRLEIAVGSGARVTLLAVGQPAEGVTTRGLRWPLAGARLEPGSSRGLANVVTEPKAEVALTAGQLLVVVSEPPAEVSLASGRLLVIEIGTDTEGVEP
jgi:thiamine pyrophosphokinase